MWDEEIRACGLDDGTKKCDRPDCTFLIYDNTDWTKGTPR